jgi:small-conductance mechanosensitive channel
MALAVAVLAFLLGVLLIPVFRPDLTVYVTVAALGFAVALQKYVTSFAGYFVLRLSRLFDVGDRVRIGNSKGDVRHLGLLHFILDEVGEGEKFGGERTGRILHVPNHVVLDQPVLNFSQAFSLGGRFLDCPYMFDEVRIPVPHGVEVGIARRRLEEVLVQEDLPVLNKAKEVYGRDIPNFLQEAEHSPRVMVFADEKHVWLVGRFVAPVRERNDLKSTVTLRFLEAVGRQKDGIPQEKEQVAAAL